jgi:hypothetical protein
MKRKLKSRGGLLLRGQLVQLLAAENDTDKARWIQVAEEGVYLGHKAGPFEFNDDVFQQLVTNFRRQPEYQRGADGWGCERVIPFDWDHASERKTGTIENQAAQGWAWDLDVRTGPDSKRELWALAEMLEPAKTLVREGKVRWTSVAVWPDAIDQASAENIGFYMSSIALTNDPFIRGMVPIAASRGGGAEPILADTQYIDPWCKPASAGECIDALRRLFGLPLQAGLGQVLGELAKLRATIAGQQQAAPGVDVGALVRALRQLFNLPTMATPEQVFAETDKLLGALAAEEELPKNETTPPILNARENETMDEKQLVAILAGRLNVGATAAAVNERLTKELDAGRDASLQLGRARDAAVLFAKGGDPMMGLKAILGALGIENPDGAIEKIGQTLSMSKQLLDAMPELASLYEGKVEAEDAQAEQDVTMALQASRVPENMLSEVGQGFMMSRTGGVDLQRLPRRQDGTLDHTPLLDETKRRALFSAVQMREAARTRFIQRMTNGTTPQNGAAPPAQQSALFQRWFAPGGQNGGQGGGGGQMLFGRQGQGSQAQAPSFGGPRWPGQTAPMGLPAFGQPQQGPALFDNMRQAAPATVTIEGQAIEVPNLGADGGIAGANETDRAKNFLLSSGYPRHNYDGLMTAANQLAEAYVHSSQQQGGGRF